MQLRKTEVADARFLELRRRFNDADQAMRSRMTEVDQAGEKRVTTMQAALNTSEEMLQRVGQRLMRLEGFLETHGKQHHKTIASVREDMGLLHSRLGELETDSTVERTHEQVHEAGNVEAVRIETEEQATNLRELSQSVSTLQEHLYDLVSRVGAQEEHHKSLRSALDRRDEQHRSLLDRFELGDWDGRIRGLQGRIDEFGRGSTLQSEDLQILQHRLGVFEQAQVQMCFLLRGSTRSPVSAVPLAGSSTLPITSVPAATTALELQPSVEDVAARPAELSPCIAEMASPQDMQTT